MFGEIPIVEKIKDLINGDGFARHVEPSFHLPAKRGHFITVEDTTTMQPTISTHPRLSGGWTTTSKSEHKVSENFLGETRTTSSDSKLNASISVNSPIPVTVGAGASASSSGKTYLITCSIKVDKVTECEFYDPPAELKTNWESLDKRDSIRQYSHYIDHIAHGGQAIVNITYEFTSSKKAASAHLKLSAANSINALMEASHTAESEGAKLSVVLDRRGFAASAAAFPKVEEKKKVLDYYNEVSEWVRTAPIDSKTQSIIYYHAKPLSAPEVGELRVLDDMENGIANHYYNLAARIHANKLLKDSYLSGRTIRLEEALAELRNNHVISRIDQMNITNSAGQYLGLSDDDKLTFIASPNCVFKLVPTNVSDLLTPNTEKFEIQVFQGDSLIGFLLAQSHGMAGEYKLRIHRDKDLKHEDAYQFLLQSDKGIANVTADTARPYRLVAQTVWSKGFMGRWDLEKGDYYLKADGTFSKDRSKAATITLVSPAPETILTARNDSALNLPRGSKITANDGLPMRVGDAEGTREGGTRGGSGGTAAGGAGAPLEELLGRDAREALSFGRASGAAAMDRRTSAVHLSDADVFSTQGGSLDRV
ncbi:MAG: hypothetical protein K0R66_865 [Gammaproteobacteria bacterium]|jgi:hypothetical protein|nr:hypothetical protein [Gammaproteobacteria bacterium]